MIGRYLVEKVENTRQPKGGLYQTLSARTKTTTRQISISALGSSARSIEKSNHHAGPNLPISNGEC